MGKPDSNSPHRSFRLTSEPDVSSTTPAVSLRRAIHLAVVQQAILLLFAALLLDGGLMFRRALVVTIAVWCFILLLLVHRGSRPTAGDILFIKIGIWPLFAFAGIVTMILSSV